MNIRLSDLGVLAMRRLLLPLLLMLALAAPAHTRANLDVLTQMLALVPASELGRAGSIVSYADYDALFTAGGVNPQTAAQFAAIQDTEDEQRWLASSLRIASGMPELVRYVFVGYETSLAVNGFEWFAVDQSLTFSAPPAVGNLLAGDFAAEAITAALTARNYEAREIDGVAALCPVEGCDYGVTLNLQDRDPAYLFGGELGQRHPIALLPSLILHSRDEATLTTMIEAHNGEDSLLATTPYQLLVDSFYYVEGALLQVNVFDAQDMMDVRTPQGGASSPGDLPPYALAALVDAQSESHQIARLLLVYEDDSVASQAAQIAWRRLSSGQLTDIYEDAGARLAEPYAISSPEGTVIVVEINYPLLDDDAIVGDERASWGRVYRAWMEAVFRGEFLPLAVNLAP
jgi:hypothetical protein